MKNVINFVCSMTVKNFVKCVIFYLTILMACLTIGFDFDNNSTNNIIVWFSILIILGFTTYKMCSGKTMEEIKEFTGIDFSNED